MVSISSRDRANSLRRGAELDAHDAAVDGVGHVGVTVGDRDVGRPGERNLRLRNVMARFLLQKLERIQLCIMQCEFEPHGVSQERSTIG